MTDDDIKLLQYMKENASVYLYGVQQEMDKKEREKYIAQHKYDIWQGSNGRWYTNLPTKEGRKQVKRSTKEKVHDAIVDYYKSQKEEPTVDSVYYDWINQKIEDKEISQGTYDRYSLDYKRVFDKQIADRKIASVTEDDLERFIRQTILGHNLTYKAYSSLRTLILDIFKYAKKKKYTAISISTFVQDLALSKNIFTEVVKKRKTRFIWKKKFLW